MKKVHFLGIGGSGASAIAAIAEGFGFEVSGCDKVPNNEFTQNFKEDQLFEGSDEKHLEGIDILAVTPAVYSLDPDNKEVATAKEKGIEVLTWQEFMGKYIEKDKFVIAVCGTHGKSTTTAMIAKVLIDAGLDPTVELGAIVPEWGTNYRIGKSEFFITEADEFNDNFLVTKPDIAVVTNVEMDHPEFFADFNDYADSFEEFLTGAKQTIVANLSDEWVAEILKVVMKKAKVSAIDYSKHELHLPLKIPGKFNQLNAAAAFQVGLLLGLDTVAIRRSLCDYGGIGRRFEHLGSYKGMEVYSDFGHHPTEIKNTIEAAKEEFKGKYLWVIYQPHMFSRTKALFKEFVEVFKNLPAQQIIIMDIYPSREIDTGIVSSSELVEAINKPNVEYIPSWDDLKNLLKSEPRAGEDILFFMGAGDIDNFARSLVR